MTTRTRRRVAAPQNNLGKAPTNSQKLIYIANKLGLKGIAGMQGTTFNLFDTVILPTSLNVQTLEFFASSNGKSNNFTNFQNQSLKAGEAMVIERVSFYLVQLQTTTLTSDTNAIVDIQTFSEQVPSVIFATPGSLKTAVMQIDIANQTVLKAMNIFENMPSFNPKSSGIAIGSIATTGATKLGPFGCSDIPLESPPVLPPNQAFSVKLRIPPIGAITTGQWGIQCVVGRFGSIFASKQTL